MKAGVRWTAAPPNAQVELWRVNWADTSPLCQGCCPLLYFSLFLKWAG